MPSTYRACTYAAVAHWLEDSRVAYKPNPKSGKSFDRYAKYEKAKTVGEALRLGSKPEDLLFDYEHGLLQVKGPLRPKPLDIWKVKDFEQLTYTDKILSRFTCRVDPKQKATTKKISQLAESLRRHRQALGRLRKLEVANKYGVKDVDDLNEHKGYWESGETFARRSIAQKEAKDVLAVLEKERRKVTDYEVLRVLRLWGFRQNLTRKNVMREGQTWILSDTVGVTNDRTGHTLMREEFRLYPDFCRLLCRWVSDHMPPELKGKFKWTSININKNYAGRLHRDSNNMGPSLLKAFGNFSGGALRYFPEDDRKRARLWELPKDAAVKLNVNRGLLLFDGNRAHEVEDFKGERYSLVYFTCARFWKLAPENKVQALQCGFDFPTVPAIRRLAKLLPAPRGYGSWVADVKKVAAAASSNQGRSAATKTAARAGKGTATRGYRFWPHDGSDKLGREKLAAKYWDKRPPREVQEETEKAEGRPDQSLGLRKRTPRGGYHETLRAIIGTSLSPKHRCYLLEGQKNLPDACTALNEGKIKVPTAVKKAGYAVVLSRRSGVYYVIWTDGKRNEALDTFGLENRSAKRHKASKSDEGGA